MRSDMISLRWLLPVLVLGALCGCAGVPAAAPKVSTDVSAFDIGVFRFASDRGCRGAGSIRKESAERVEAVCGCVLDTLDATLDTAGWKDLVVASRQYPQDASQWKTYIPAVAACAGAKPHSHDGPPLLGTWEWTMRETGCKERYEFLPGGIAKVQSGQEFTENKYVISESTEDSGRYRMAFVIDKTNGGKDCTDVQQGSPAGEASVVYIEFASDRHTLAICFTPGGSQCIGPLQRVRQ